MDSAFFYSITLVQMLRKFNFSSSSCIMVPPIQTTIMPNINKECSQQQFRLTSEKYACVKDSTLAARWYIRTVANATQDKSQKFSSSWEEHPTTLRSRSDEASNLQNHCHNASVISLCISNCLTKGILETLGDLLTYFSLRHWERCTSPSPALYAK